MDITALHPPPLPRTPQASERLCRGTDRVRLWAVFRLQAHQAVAANGQQLLKGFHSGNAMVCQTAGVGLFAAATQLAAAASAAQAIGAQYYEQIGRA